MMTVAKIQMPEKGVFVCRVLEAHRFKTGDSCLVELDYGKDVGEILEVYDLSAEEISKNRIPAFRVLRLLRPEDQKVMEANAKEAQVVGNELREIAATKKIFIKLLHLRFSYDRKKFFFRYSASDQVDLRSFRGTLERKYRTKIDLWQIGIRDEAAMIGALGICGRPVCCSQKKYHFRTVNVQMVKDQGLPLNPVTINGTCGRLKCCLRYELEQYQEAAARMPKIGTLVRGSNGKGETVEGVIIARNILQGTIQIRTHDDRYCLLPADHVQILKKSSGFFKKDNKKDSTEGNQK